ncbi:hypothetical protein [Selenihalanaerobacter shriftii]|uniref:Uncharacterized protein n=1 Tax=Selenihalanaerobacter shriftii TaxID=142842 RepID=A0A1T4JM82_9FIRM|nr:hypothetical protein [Selenihalanaerobacter shriftii]SJZ31207.1 hypothetical protein SAMN02745118_00179 [Selenihalanaerobacter shriftii]
MTDFAEEIKQLKDDLDKAKSKRYRYEARMEELKKQRKKILNKLEENGVKPEELDDEINSLESKLQKAISQAKELLPQDILND